MANELSTAGITLQCCKETVSGTRPTSGYRTISNIRSIPDFNPEPNTIDVTDLSETEFMRYITGLKDVGSAIGFGANHTEEFHTAWDALVDEYESALEESLSMWFAVVIPKLSRAFYFAGQPSPLGLAAIEVNAGLQITAYIAPNDIGGWAAKPTAA